MKRIFILLTTLCPLAFAQPVPISRQLHSFSPMAQIYLKHLGLADKNNNGVIDRGAGEGYEAFTAKYGNADIGFYANGVVLGAANAKLEEPEIINHYYISIRFKPDFQTETTAIEGDVKAFVYANNIPLVWLDDQQGTVMKEVNRILGEGWQNQSLTLSQAENKYREVLDKLNNGHPVSGLVWGNPSDTGHYTLPQFSRKKEGYCFEAAQFGFWFFSQLKINSIMVITNLAATPSYHGIIKQTDIQKIIDYFNTSQLYIVQDDKWQPLNPLRTLGYYYLTEYEKTKRSTALEQAIIYDKYDITNHALMMRLTRPSGQQQYAKIIAHGEFVLENIDIQKIIRDGHIIAKNNLRIILVMLLISYTDNQKTKEADKMYNLLNQYYSEDDFAKQYLDEYKKSRNK
jgi:hypothetical protein